MTGVMTPKMHSPRDSTVRSAALLFRERGVAGTGLRDVVEHAGAPRGSLQHYFPGGKRELLAEAMAWMAERAARPLRAAATAEVPPPPWEVVSGGLAEDGAVRVALLVVSAAEGALVISRARRDLAALDAVQGELELLLRP